MRGVRGRRRTTAALAVAAVLVALGATTMVVVALGGHRPPPVLPAGTRPLPPPPVVVAPAGNATVPGSDPTPAADVTAAPAPRTVHIDETSGPIAVRVGDLIEVDLRGDPTDRWSEPDTPTPQLLARVSGSASADGDAQGTFKALAAGQGMVEIVRSASCSSGPGGGVCAAQARRIAVTITR